ncbi:hypothetical protein [Paracoccus sulfuroxidans]|uniref:Uncharacterized protein n=1 Tax=Paracoccus sulfuroxidans TaxID=384678 RepID=A0A562NL69_9RHOB|nr:hypothetical protein [Paracoccus sulfuroxidans]TWI32741.1 hypothetical protein IQ24_02616 [Paracoccus sulfuroxidans]
MIEIEGPDGVIYEFPEGTDDATMAKAMQQVYGAPQPAQPSGVPDDVRARWQAAKAGTLEVSPESAARHEAASQMTGQGGLNNAAQAAGDGLFFGFGDEISARLNALTGYDANSGTYGNRTNYDDQLRAVRGQEDQFRQDHPVASIGAEFGGAMIPAAFGAGLLGQAASWKGKIASGAAAGGMMGAAYGFGEGEGGLANRVERGYRDGILGLALGAALPAATGAVRSVAQGRAAKKALNEAAKNAPTSAELRAMGNALYKQIDDAGVQIKPEAFDDMRGGLLDYLRANTGFDELPGPGSLTPNTGRVMQIMDQAGERMAAEPTAALPFRSLDQMRRQAGAAAGNVANKTDQRAGVAVIEQLDDFVQRLGPDDVLGGDLDALKTAIPKAREVWSRMSKSQLVDNAMERSENYLSGAASGVRNQFKNILQNKKLASQFTAAEKAALRSVTHGSALDQIINLAGGGLAQMGSIGGGFAAGGPLGALAGTGLAAGQRKLAEAVTMRSAERARAAIASGALRQQGVLDALAIAGQRPERLTGTGLLGMLPQSADALQTLLTGR